MSETMSNQLADAFNKDRLSNKDNKNKKKPYVHRKLKTIKPNEEDGKDHINIVLSAKTKLGKFLAPEYAGYINTPIGRFASMEIFMRFLNTPDLPSDLNNINKVKIFYKKYKQLRFKKVFVPNYWALVAAGFVCKIKSNVEMENLLKKSIPPITSYRLERPRSVLDMSSTTIITMNEYRVRYVEIVEKVRLILKEYRNQELQKLALHRLILEFKDNPDEHLYAGVPFISKEERSIATNTEQTVEGLTKLIIDKEIELTEKALEASKISKEKNKKKRAEKEAAKVKTEEVKESSSEEDSIQETTDMEETSGTEDINEKETEESSVTEKE